MVCHRQSVMAMGTHGVQRDLMGQFHGQTWALSGSLAKSHVIAWDFIRFCEITCDFKGSHATPNTGFLKRFRKCFTNVSESHKSFKRATLNHIVLSPKPAKAFSKGTRASMGAHRLYLM